MGKKHQTFEGEPEETPVAPDQPEIRPPADPKEPEIPAENPGTAPEEISKVEQLPNEGGDQFYK
jgi:hypothetical protein